MIKERRTTNQNFIAYKEDLEKGCFTDLSSDTHVIYFEGEFVVTCPDSELNEMIKEMIETGRSGFFHTQPNKPPKKPVRLLSPRKQR